jgi:predicted Rdx family selenoprotein
MENEQEEVIVDNLEDTNEEDAGDAEVKPKRTPQERLAHHKGIVERMEKKLGLRETLEKKLGLRDTLEKSYPPEAKLDYGLLAFHNTKSDSVKIESSEDKEFLRKTLQETGKSQESILESNWFIQELKEKQANRASEAAVPKGTKHSGRQVGDEFSVAYAKYRETGQLPEDRELKEKIVDYRFKQETVSSQFYNSGIK